MNEYRKKSYFKGSTGILQTCTSCCPFDAKNIPHPYFNDSSINRTGLMNKNSDVCCLSKLQVDCRIQSSKKKKKRKKNKQYDSSLSVQSISSTSSPNPKRKKISSSNSQTSASSLSVSSNTSASEQSLLSKNYHKSANARRSPVHINASIQNLQTSIDNLTQLIVHHRKSSPPTTLSFLDRLRGFFDFFKSSDHQLNDECRAILHRHHLSKENLLHVYHLFDRNDKIFLNWLRPIMPEYFLPLLLNYVKHFHSISTDNDSYILR